MNHHRVCVTWLVATTFDRVVRTLLVQNAFPTQSATRVMVVMLMMMTVRARGTKGVAGWLGDWAGGQQQAA